jgi:hypothetical protein
MNDHENIKHEWRDEMLAYMQTSKRRDHLGDSVRGNVNELKKQDVRVWTEFNWHRIRFSGVLCVTKLFTFVTLLFLVRFFLQPKWSSSPP